MREPSAIVRFVRSIDFRHRLAASITAVAACAVVSACLVWIVDELVPAWTWVAATVAVLALGLFAWRHFTRGGASIAELDRELGLRDGLRTWVAGVDDGPMADWLERDLDTSLSALPSATKRRTVRERLAPLRYLVPILLALIVLRWLQPDVEIPGLRGTGGGGGGGAGGGSANEQVASGQPLDAQPPRGPDPQRPPDEDEPEDPPPPEDPVDPPDPKALLERPIRDDFVVPQFVGSGPSRRANATVARVPDGDEGSQPPPERPTGTGDDPPPTVDDFEFDRAKERALRSRHVAADERSIVRRYFELLMARRRDR